MKKIWSFIKKVLKRFFPATVHILMREVNGLHGAMAAREANLSHQLGVAKAETQSLMKQIEEQQAERLDRMNAAQNESLSAQHAQLDRMEAAQSERLDRLESAQEERLDRVERTQAEKLDRVERTQAEKLDRLESEQGKRLDRLADLFESANRENLRLFFDSREERKEMDQRYAQLAGQYEALNKEMAALREHQAELEKKLAETRKFIGEQESKLNTQVRRSESMIRTDVFSARQFFERRQNELLDPSLYPHALKLWYWQKTGKVLDLENPKTFNEKIQWMKLYDNNPLKTQLADKLLVRDWVKEKIGEDHLIPLLGAWDRVEEIDFDALPNQFVLKANHGSGWNIIVKDKTALDIAETKKKLSSWMKTNFAYSNGFEMQYLNIEPRILAEEYAGSLMEYQFWCFHGVPKFISAIDRPHEENNKRTYDLDWNEQEFVTSQPRLKEPVPRPKKLHEMVMIVEKLCSGFPFVRVDLLDDGTKVYAGELTFSPASGLCRWDPHEQDFVWGEQLRLP